MEEKGKELMHLQQIILKPRSHSELIFKYEQINTADSYYL